MPNGKPGDHLYTDIVTHGTDVYSERISELVREISKLSDDKGRRALADMLYSEFNVYSRPDIAKLEAILIRARDAALNDARQRGYEV